MSTYDTSHIDRHGPAAEVYDQLVEVYLLAQPVRYDYEAMLDRADEYAEGVIAKGFLLSLDTDAYPGV